MHLIGIFGTGRNGSTLLCRLLDGSPGAYMHPIETVFLDAMADLARYRIVRRRVHNNTLDRTLPSMPGTQPTRRLLRYYRAQLDEMRRDYLANVKEPVALGEDPEARLLRQESYTPAAFAEAFLEATALWVCPELADAQGRIPAGIFKSIETLHLAAYERAFADMRFVHIVRDPMDIWASMKRTLMVRDKRPAAYLGGDTLTSFLRCRWLPHVRFLAARDGDPRHHVVRYEDLVVGPEASVAAISAHCGIPEPREPAVQTQLNGRHFKSMQLNPSQPGVSAPEKVERNMAARYDYKPVVTGASGR